MRLEDWEILNRGCYDKAGQPIFPQKFSLEHLKNLETEKGSYEFSCQYLNNPTDPETAQFKLKDIQYFDELPINRLLFCAFDPAFSQREQADYTAGVVLATDDAKPFNLYLDYYIREKLTASQVIDEVYRFRDSFDPEWIGIEANSAQKVLYEFIYKDPRISRGIPIQEIKPDGDKFRRILKLQPFVENHRFFIRRNMKEFVDEAMMFPVGPHDDLLDACAMAVKIACETTERKVRAIEGTEGYFNWLQDKQKQMAEDMERLHG